MTTNNFDTFWKLQLLYVLSYSYENLVNIKLVASSFLI